MKIWLICIFQSHIYGGSAGVATVSHGLTRCHPVVSRLCHGVAPVWCRFITVLPGVVSVYPGLLGLHSVLIYEIYIAPKVGTIVVGLLHRQFFYACALQHGNVHAVVAVVRKRV